jgi:hypothetical protein
MPQVKELNIGFGGVTILPESAYVETDPEGECEVGFPRGVFIGCAWDLSVPLTDAHTDPRDAMAEAREKTIHPEQPAVYKIPYADDE